MPTWCRHVHVRPHCFILTEACSCRLELAYFAGKISKNRLVWKNAVALAYFGSCRLLVMGSWFNIGILRLQIIGDKEEWKYRESRNNQNLTDWWVTKFSSVWGSARVPSARRASAICLLPMALSFHSTFYSWGESEGVHKFNRSELTLHKQVIKSPSINQHHLL